MNIEQVEEVRKLSAKLGKTKKIYRDQCIRDCQCVQTADFPEVRFGTLWTTEDMCLRDAVKNVLADFAR